MARNDSTITIVIPTLKRPESLRRCLASIDRQELQADKTLVMVQESDIETLNLVKELRVNFERIDSPGIIFAIQRSLEMISTDLVAFIDDDVTLPRDWVYKAKNHFLRLPEVGALGGTDRQNSIQLDQNIGVGKVTYYGKLIGNHHLAAGPKRNVDFLKGCNMVMRTSIAKKYSPVFQLLKGQGAQVGNDLVLSLTSRLLGFNTIFDPEFYVFHHVEPRKDSSQRDLLDERERYDLIYNIFLIKLTFAKIYLRPLVLIYQVLVGDKEVPGLVRSLFLRRCRLDQTIKDLKDLLISTSGVWGLSSEFREPLQKVGKRSH